MTISVEFEPVQPHAARQHELHGGQRRGERDEAGPVEAHLGEAVVRRQRPAHADGGADTDRHQHVERPAPAIDLGEIAADDGTERRRDRDRHAEDRHHHRMLAPRERIEQDRLRQRHDRRPRPALQDAPQHQHLERLRHAAKQRRQREQADRVDHHAPGAEARHQPAGHRRHHGGRENVEGHHPGDLVLGRRQRALHLRQDGRRRQQRRAVERGPQNDGRHGQIALRRGHEPGGFVGVDFGGAQAQSLWLPCSFPCGIARSDCNLAYYYIT